jgi:hypothetical protein
MKAVLRVASLLSLVATTGACATSPPSHVTLTPQARIGPAYSAKPARVLLAPPSCGSLEKPCPKELVDSVSTIVTSELELRGHAVTARTELVPAPRERTETHDEATRTAKQRSLLFENRYAERTTRTHVELVGSTYEDLSPAEKRALMAESGAEGVVTVRLILGAKDGLWTPSQEVEVVVRLGVASADDMAWASRCVARSHEFERRPRGRACRALRDEGSPVMRTRCASRRADQGWPAGAQARRPCVWEWHRHRRAGRAFRDEWMRGKTSGPETALTARGASRRDGRAREGRPRAGRRPLAPSTSRRTPTPTARAK